MHTIDAVAGANFTPAGLAVAAGRRPHNARHGNR